MDRSVSEAFHLEAGVDVGAYTLGIVVADGLGYVILECAVAIVLVTAEAGHGTAVGERDGAVLVLADKVLVHAVPAGEGCVEIAVVKYAHTHTAQE